MRIRLTPKDRRECARLSSERWRRAHGIGPRRPAQRPWLALSISRSTYYRRRAKARHEAALAHSELCDISASMEAEDAAAVLDRLQWQVAELRTHLDRLAAANAIMAVELSRPVPLVW
jgi:hypothetical protein